jgi:D-alanyl-D-alanine carboxypeptidase/D-alanyl-D-alanine-endopeptidase (penicillin-binding protein 4)
MTRRITLYPALLLLAFATATATATPAAAQDAALQARVEARLAEAGPGTRFGLVVADADGKELIAIAPDGRFIPASNTKVFTTAAAFATIPSLAAPDTEGGTAVRLEGEGGQTDVVLEGRGDARLSSAADCVTDCLAALADAVAARTRRVRNVTGDDSLYPDQRWSPGMSWNNLSSRYGTAASALTLDDNEAVVTVRPAAPGKPPAVAHIGYYTLDNRVLTAPAGTASTLAADRLPGSMVLRLTGTVPAGAEQVLRVGIDDPAHYAAWRFRQLLEARGVKVRGAVAARHRPPGPADDPAARGAAPAPRPPHEAPLAQLTAQPLAEDLTEINKVSQNLHAELMLRRVGLQRGTGSIADGVAAVRAMLEQAGVPRTAWDLSDGSGMSTYNRASPRALIRLLRWIDAQPWGEAFRATFPVGGVDGTLARRFKGTPLEGKLFAKTGSLNATNALSGWLVAKSGRVLTFSAFANDVPDGATGTPPIDAALVLIAEAN